MIITSSLFGVFLGILAPAQPAPAVEQPTSTVEQPAPFVPAETELSCSIALQGSDRRIKAEVKAPDAGFEGRVHLQLTGKGFMHDDLRPVQIAPGAILTLQVPSVPLPNPLQGALILLDSSGQIVCTAHL